MHTVKDILVHYVNLGTGFFADFFELVSQRVYSQTLVNLNHHRHSEHILKHALGHFNDINVSVGAGCRNLG
jgi:hypothetical protein